MRHGGWERTSCMTGAVWQRWTIPRSWLWLQSILTDPAWDRGPGS